MNEEVKHLFHQLADLPPEQREQEYERLQVSESMRAEVESLLTFDSSQTHSLSDIVRFAAKQFIRSSRKPE